MRPQLVTDCLLIPLQSATKKIFWVLALQVFALALAVSGNPLETHWSLDCNDDWIKNFCIKVANVTCDQETGTVILHNPWCGQYCGCVLNETTSAVAATEAVSVHAAPFEGQPAKATIDAVGSLSTAHTTLATQTRPEASVAARTPDTSEADDCPGCLMTCSEPGVTPQQCHDEGAFCAPATLPSRDASTCPYCVLENANPDCQAACFCVWNAAPPRDSQPDPK
ncbi:hypothetical protein B0T17DRAFT_383353 [Bombardia bombarda]|uniref:Uncharacterized protein n=1 Tax=Bombardia bombarda TaxID=252184 RepID=A0AA40BVP0_9PEZI|nr:hypothetical protein B0T17DRAFT_383353 [Bombardia bombarda]